MLQELPRLFIQLAGSRRLRHRRRTPGIPASQAKVLAEGTGSSRSTIGHSLMPVVQMPGATALVAMMPDEPVPAGLMPAGVMSVAVKAPAKGDQGMTDIHAGPQCPARLGKIEMQDQSTDINVGMTTMTTAPTPAVSGTTGTTR